MTLVSLLLVKTVACEPADGNAPDATGGVSPTSGGVPNSTGGVGTGGVNTGGVSSGGLSTGGTANVTGGAPVISTGGASGGSTGGASAQGGNSAGASPGGTTSGGSAGSTTGGQSQGGNTGGAIGTGGSAGGAGGNNGGSGSGGKAEGEAAGSVNGGSAGLGGDSRCANGTFIVCESFESTAVGAVPSGWTRDGSAQLVQVASDQAARGQRALKIGAAASGPRRLTRDAADFGAAHWGRLFYRVQTPPALPGSGAVIHSTIASLQGNGPNIGSAEYRVVDTVEDSKGMHQYLYNVQPSGAEFGKGSSYDYRYDGNWHCAEWQIDAGTQSYHFYVDGKEVTQIAISNGAGNFGSGSNRSELPMTFSQFKIGWYNYQSANPGFVAWIDEVAIAHARVGCGN
jgi:hypothetical protein